MSDENRCYPKARPLNAVTLLLTSVDDKGNIKALINDAGCVPSSPVSDGETLESMIKLIAETWTLYDPCYIFSLANLQDVDIKDGRIEIILTCHIPVFLPDTAKIGSWRNLRDAMALQQITKAKYERYYNRSGNSRITNLNIQSS